LHAYNCPPWTNIFGKQRQKTYDVCIIGSGAAGGTAAWVLTAAGIDVVMLEAGPLLDPMRHYTEHLWPYNLPHRGAGIGGSGYNAESSRELDVAFISGRVPGEPYINAPDSPFGWDRARILGGRTNHFTRVWLRMSEADFEGYSRDGAGSDWPIRFSDLAPYYDKSDTLVGAYGTVERIPSAPDGIFQPPPRPRCSDLLIQKGCQKLNIPCIPGRAAILTRALHGRPPCHYCNQCERGCRANSNFSSSLTLIPAALATGHLTIVPNAMARALMVGSDGKVRTVSYIDKTTRTEQQIQAKAFLVGASACESARLLLNSRSSLFPQGLANSSGVVGRYLMDTAATGVVGYFPQLTRLPPHNHDGTGSVHMYVPWWRWSQKNEFLRGYHIEIYGGRNMPRVGMFQDVVKETEGYGLNLKRSCHDQYGGFVSLEGRGETIPDERSYCEIDPDVVDQWGIPVLRFHFAWGENEKKMAQDMNETFHSIIAAAGGRAVKEVGSPSSRWGRLYPGGVAHEVGTVRMGSNPQTSALNGFCQAHDVKNLFVTDGGCFPSNPEKNPTPTIMALSWRASEYLMEQAKRLAL
jgi:choline dehydrogenase-like flavoprotein